ncbi:ABC transporter permease [Cohnella algarum]|uniref:ABC transporter permease n=1 Tax=Cohnella algarum TaxID=2044859 RepID=UPI001967BD9D|nr:ABC transporter permease [Cohnella algarum]MBN2981088.1 ABC transporter permease [Cohnella algarum]
MLVMAALSSAVIVFGYAITSSMSALQEKAGQWGYDTSDVVATVFNPSGFNRDEFERALQSDSRILSIGRAHSLTGIVEGDSDSESAGIAIMTFEGSLDEFGYATLSGRNPQYKNEIAIGVNVARTFNNDVGDTVVVYIQGQRNRYLVTGIYQAIANMSNSARLTGETPFSASNALPLTSEGLLDYMIRLKDNAQATAVANEQCRIPEFGNDRPAADAYRSGV